MYSKTGGELISENRDDISPGRRTSPYALRSLKKLSVETPTVVEEKPIPYEAPSRSQLTQFRKAIEQFDDDQIEELILHNPRYLVNCNSDSPTIIFEGCRYNALHVAAKCGNLFVCDLILKLLGADDFARLSSNSQYLRLLYPDDNDESLERRRKFLLDMFLNTPDKALHETPLHFAAKNSNWDVMRLLYSLPICDKLAKNKYGETAVALAKARASEDDNALFLRDSDCQMAKSSYVGLYRSDDCSILPFVKPPCIGFPPIVLEDETVYLSEEYTKVRRKRPENTEKSMRLSAYAGPMSHETANQFYIDWSSKRMRHLDTQDSNLSKISNSEASIDLETSSGDDIFTTPPETPPCVYINGSSLSRDDLDALSAIKALNVDPDEFPLVYKWKNRMWKKAKKNNEEKEVLHKSPHSFVFHRGKVGLYVRRLIRDVRRVMEPYTATKLKVLKKNVLKDFASVAGPLGVSHMVVFTRTTASLNMRLIRLPRGPTLTFRVHSYSLNRDIISSLRKAQPTPQKYFHHPLLVMNNFQHDQRHIKLMESTFQNMFPSINVNSVKLGDIKRCLLLNYDTESDTIEFRHYAIKLAPSGVSSSIKKLMKKKVPDMGKYSDISDFFLKPVHSSDSEYEGPPGENEVELPENVKTKAVTSKVGIKLTEIGPRMKLQLIKLQDGFCGGEVLYHKFIHKSAAQKEAARKTKLAKDRLREKRRKEQEENVKRKNAVQSEEVARKRVKFKVETSNASTAETT